MPTFAYLVRGLLLALTVAPLWAAQSHAATVPGSIPANFLVSDSGAAKYTVPLALPPGTAGMTPSLSLNYSSQGGNGLLGVGWSLSGLSSITRCAATVAQDGYRNGHGINLDTSDKFCLDGQRLIAISGTYGGDGTEYRTELEGFSKIVSYGVAGTGPAYFKAWTKSGQILEFGNSADSRIEAQGKPTALTWAINKQQDTSGNYYSVSYTEDNANGQYYPTRIDYTGNANQNLSPYNSVQFSYETRPDMVQRVEGVLTRLTVRLKNVKTYVSTTLVKDYLLAYQKNATTSNSELTSFTDCDVAGICLPATTFGWAPSATETTSQSGWMQWLGNGFTQFNANTFSGDYNGDGKADLITAPYVTGGKIYVLPGGQVNAQPIEWNSNGNWWPGYMNRPAFRGGWLV